MLDPGEEFSWRDSLMRPPAGQAELELTTRKQDSVPVHSYVAVASIGTDLKPIYNNSPGECVDFFIQNRGVNILYFLSGPGVAADGILIYPGDGNFSATNWTGDIYLVASGAGTAVMYALIVHKIPGDFI